MGTDDLRRITQDESQFRTYVAESIGEMRASMKATHDDVREIKANQSQQWDVIRTMQAEGCAVGKANGKRLDELSVGPRRQAVGSGAASAGILVALVEGVRQLIKLHT